jgi:methionine-rich copper-binding protein CopC
MRRKVYGALALFVGLATNALAHAVLVESTPPLRGSVAGPEIFFRLRFNSRVDAARSTLKLVMPDGKVHSLRIAPQTSPEVLGAKSEDMGYGRYTLRWQVLSADGHITRGEVPFSVR